MDNMKLRLILMGCILTVIGVILLIRNGFLNASRRNTRLRNSISYSWDCLEPSEAHAI